MTPRTDTAWEPSPVRPFGRPDLYIALAVFVLSWITAAFYLPAFRASGGHGEFYQDQFAPAVMSACGRGYVVPASADTPPSLQAFLDRRADTFNCADLPARLTTTPPGTMQAAFRYLMLSASLVWRIRGVSWNAIDIVLSALFAMSLTGGYVALRLVSGRTLSIIGTILWLGSPLHLGNLPHLRDYAKTPYFVLTLIGMALVVRERRPWRLALIGALFGVSQGIGFGMRTDVILNFAPFLLVLFAAGSRGLREQIVPKIVCAALALAIFTGIAWPILRAYGESEGLSHVALLGLTEPFDGPLGVRPAPYDFGYLYSDSFVSAQVHGDAGRTARRSVSEPEPPYAAASRAYYIKLATTFPGDFLTRMTGSVIQTLNLPFSITYGRAPTGVTGFLARVDDWRASLMLMLIGTGVLVALLILFFVSLSHVKDGLIAFAVIVFWTAYPFIQFHGRHVFHLEILVIALFVALLSLVARSVRQFTQRAWPSMTQALRATALVFGLIAASILILLGTRAVQSLGVQQLLTSYEKAATGPAAPASIFDPPASGAPFQQVMLSVDVTAKACEAPPEILTIRYQAVKDRDFSREFRLPATPAGKTTRVFVPVYAMDAPGGEASRFTGIDVPPAAAACVRISRVRGIDQLLWVDATLAPGWQRQPLHQRLYLGAAFPERVWLKIAQWWPAFAALG